MALMKYITLRIPAILPIDEHALAKQEALEILSRSDVTGSNIVATGDFRKLLSWGIWNMARKHWRRNISAIFRRGKEIQLPFSCFP